MPQFKDYQLAIFDCDGVILDSNVLKVDAMRNALIAENICSEEVENCTRFFANNFGKSRLFHVDYFIENLLNIKKSMVEQFRNSLLSSYSQQCTELYLIANITPFMETLLEESNAIKYVASGSEQQELRDIFDVRKLTNYFNNVLGSPIKKDKHLADILAEHPQLNAVMIGDAVSDLEAAQKNNIDFIFYSPFSNVEQKMRELCLEFNYRIIDSFEEVLKEL